MKILITDGLAKDAVEALQSFAQVDMQFYEQEALGEALADYDVLIVRSATEVRKETIDKALSYGKLKLVIRAGVGIDNIDHAYAREKGLVVRNTPSANSNAMAELTLAQLFAVSRFIAASNVTMRQGAWNKTAYRGVELMGKEIGLIGFGHTARLLADKCHALGMKVYYFDIVGEDKNSPYTFVESIEKLITMVDYITLHTPKTPDGKPLIGEKELSTMRDGVRIVNCARGGLVDEVAVLKALESGKVAALGLDVFLNEPNPSKALLENPNVCVTPHIGAQTLEAQLRVGDEVMSVVKEEMNL